MIDFEQAMIANGYTLIQGQTVKFWQHKNGFRVGYEDALSFWEFTKGVLVLVPW